MSHIAISNIAQLPESLRAAGAAYFDPTTGDVLPQYWPVRTREITSDTYYAGFHLVSPAEAPYVPPVIEPPYEPPPESPALIAARAARAAAELDAEAAWQTYLAIPSPTAGDRDPVTAAEARMADWNRLVTLLST
jgi:hypothetical protein